MSIRFAEFKIGNRSRLEWTRSHPANLLAALHGAVVAVCLLAAAGVGIAQPASPPAVVGGGIAALVEIAMGTVNGDVRCSPPRARLPAQDAIELRVVNRAE